MEERFHEEHREEIIQPSQPAETDVGRKGGAAEVGYMGRYYEPTVTAVTDMVVPATRIQWGPVFAGFLIALATTFLWTALGIGLGFGAGAFGYWVVGFGALGLFLGSMFAARTARADIVPAIMHAVMIWALMMLIDVFAFGSIGGGMIAAIVGSPGVGAAPSAGAIGAGVTRFGWWFFVGFIVLLAASILGGLAGINPTERHEETTTVKTT